MTPSDPEPQPQKEFFVFLFKKDKGKSVSLEPLINFPSFVVQTLFPSQNQGCGIGGKISDLSKIS